MGARGRLCPGAHARVFYNKASRATAERNCDVGRFTTAYAFLALLVQYSTERALGRLCAVGPLDDPERPEEVETCELTLVADNLDADYGALWLLALLLAVLCAADVCECVLHAKMLRPADMHSGAEQVRSLALELLHAGVALVPCAAVLAFAGATLEYTTTAHLSYLACVFLALAFSCCRRVWTALSHRAQHLIGHPGAGALIRAGAVIGAAAHAETAEVVPAALHGHALGAGHDGGHDDAKHAHAENAHGSRLSGAHRRIAQLRGAISKGTPQGFRKKWD